MFRADFEIDGHILIHKNGVLVVDQPNLVVPLGKQVVVSRIFSNTEFSVANAIGVGIGLSPPQVWDIALGNQLARVNFDAGFPTRSGNVETCKTTFQPGVGTGNWSETGLFTGGGQLISRSTFTQLQKLAGDYLSVTWIITVN